MWLTCSSCSSPSFIYESPVSPVQSWGFVTAPPPPGCLLDVPMRKHQIIWSCKHLKRVCLYPWWVLFLKHVLATSQWLHNYVIKAACPQRSCMHTFFLGWGSLAAAWPISICTPRSGKGRDGGKGRRQHQSEREGGENKMEEWPCA